MNQYKVSVRKDFEFPKGAEGVLEEVSKLAETEVPYMIEKVRGGLGMEEFHTMREMLEVSEERMGGLLGMSRATLHRRKKAGQMDRAESDRLVRYARLQHKAVSLFGDEKKAAVWLGRPAAAFGGESPLDYADTEIGAREVENLIGRLEHGVFS